MATRTWIGGTDNAWDTTPGNWDTPPASGDNVILSPSAAHELSVLPVDPLTIGALTDAGGKLQLGTFPGSILTVTGAAVLSGSYINGISFHGAATLLNCIIDVNGPNEFHGPVTLAGNTSLIVGAEGSLLFADDLAFAAGAMVNGGTIVGAGGGLSDANIAAIAAASATAILFDTTKKVKQQDITDIQTRVLLALPAFGPGLVNGLGKVAATGYLDALVAGYREGESPEVVLGFAPGATLPDGEMMADTLARVVALAGDEATLQGPNTPPLAFTLYKGFDYYNDNGQAVELTVRGLRNLTGAAVSLETEPGGTLVKMGTVVRARNVGPQLVRFEFSSTETAAMTTGVKALRVKAVLADGRTVRHAGVTMTVKG